MKIDNYYIIGTTLWSDIKIDVPKHIVKIHGMNRYVYEQKFFNSLKFLRTQIEKCKEKNGKAIVITHYLPSFSLLPVQKVNALYASLYASNLDWLIQEPVKLWIYGHSHICKDTVINGVRVVSNQKGKGNEGVENYEKNFVIEI